MTNPVVASIFPMVRRLDKWNFFPKQFWVLPGVPKGSTPATIEFTDQNQRVFIGSGGTWEPQYSVQVVPAADIAADFIETNTRFATGQRNGGEPGVWLVGSLGQDVTMNVAAASNSPAVFLRLDRPHGMNGSSEVTVANGQGFFGQLNGVWRASPIDEMTIQIPVDSTRMGDYYASGSACQVYMKSILTLDQEAQIKAKRQDIFAMQWVEDARRLATANRMNRIIPLHHAMADWLGLDNEPWRRQHSAAATKKCQFCQQVIPVDAIVCPVCSQTVDAVRKYELERVERAKVEAYKAQRKAEQDELDRQERERNQQLRQQQRQAAAPVVIQTVAAEPVEALKEL